MKILLCGKGGCGKSTVSVLLGLAFQEQGKRVLLIDMDESNFGLHRQLGTELPKDFTLYFGSKKGIYRKMDDPEGNGHAFSEKWHFSDIPEEFCAKRDNIYLMAVGKLHDAGEGCACAMGTVAKELLGNFEKDPSEVIIADTEAGVEHFGRGVDTQADLILMIVDPSYESIMLSEKVAHMGAQFGKPVYFLLNKADEKKAALIRNAISQPERILGVLPEKEELAMKGLAGERIDEIPEEIRVLAETLRKEVPNGE